MADGIQVARDTRGVPRIRDPKFDPALRGKELHVSRDAVARGHIEAPTSRPQRGAGVATNRPQRGSRLFGGYR